MPPRILCAIDFSDSARHALRVAVEQAKAKGASLELVHVEDRPLWMREPPVHLPGDASEATIAATERELEAWRREAAHLAPDLTVVAHHTSGVPWAQIVGIANADPTIELIVVGRHGRSAIARALIGSVAEHVVHHAPCSVLVVRPSRA